MERNVAKLSTEYRVRLLTDSDVPAIYALCAENDQFYRYCPPDVTEESIREDMGLLPPGKERRDKYYVGFFREDHLAAVMDLIDGYPDNRTAYIGFFMLEKAEQGRGGGTELISQVCDALGKWGFERAMLCYVKANPQASHFWRKNGFQPIREVEKEYRTVVEAERSL